MSTDIHGKAYAKVGQLKAGDIIHTDPGFTCIETNAVRTIHEDAEGLYFQCSHGVHYLNGQHAGTYYVGIYPGNPTND